MKKTDLRYSAYVQILKEELVPAMGCTEPIALAYAAAVARKTLGVLPDKVEVAASGSIIKNVTSERHSCGSGGRNCGRGCGKETGSNLLCERGTG